MTFKKILCPTDFSEASYEGLSYAVSLAARGETEICVVHVEPPEKREPSLTGETNKIHAEAARRAEAVWNLRDVLAERVPAHVRSRPLLRSGDAAGEILRAANEEHADMIVLTTHGAAGWRGGVLGQVAETVLRNARCPVLTISGPASGNPYFGSENGISKYDSVALVPALVATAKAARDGD